MVPICIALLSKNRLNLWTLLPWFSWGIGLVIHGLSVFEVFNFFTLQWEKEKIEKRLGRKL